MEKTEETKEEYNLNRDLDRTDLDEIVQKIEEEQDFVESRIDMEEKASEKPTVGATCPFRVCLKKGKTYYYCTCGKSTKNPF
mmetsp:Transcript_15877/g.15622  ORF Transcript_15877/g.15622 Transcript_15877/m.15622 type:complete len:82 (+) Transcript_15877:10-255(+)